MATTLHNPRNETQEQIAQLRHALLPTFVLLTAIGLYIFVLRLLYGRTDVDISVYILPLLLITVGLGWSWHWRTRRYGVAAVLLILLMTGTLLLPVTIGSPVTALALGLIVVLIANALIGTVAVVFLALLIPLVIFASATILSLQLGGYRPTPIFAYYITFALLLWFSQRPTQGLVESALHAWSQTREALTELRERRAELSRTVRALEETTIRLERANNQLIVAQREAETARAIKAHLAATLSHELRGPLNLILGFVELMALSPESYPEPLPQAYRGDILTVYRNTQHLLTLVNDVLDLSKIEARKLPLVRDLISINEDVVIKTIESVQTLAERKGLNLCRELDPGLPNVIADATRLRQVLMNLLNNAIYNTRRGGITVRTRHKDGDVIVSVEDTGPGIPKELEARLFREFEQLRGSDLEDRTGTGLGLSISKHLVELHGGQIWAQSEEGRGSTFTFSLPVDATALALPETRTASPGGPNTATSSYLVLHQDPRVAQMLSRHIGDCQVIAITDPQELVLAAEGLQPLAIIVDQEMRSSMIEGSSRIARSIPIVSCGLPRREPNDPLGHVLRYLVKPVTQDVLLAAVRCVQCQGETTILLVDDDPDAIRLVERMLLALPRPFRILKAYDGLQALDIVRQTPPDLILLDLWLPRLDGRGVIETLQNDALTRTIPIVVLSAQDWLDDCAQISSPFTIDLPSPVDISTGAHCIRAAIESLKPAHPTSTPSERF